MHRKVKHILWFPVSLFRAKQWSSLCEMKNSWSIMVQPARIIYQNSGMKPFIRLYRVEIYNFNPWLINGSFWDRISCSPGWSCLLHHWVWWIWTSYLARPFLWLRSQCMPPYPGSKCWRSYPGSYACLASIIPTAMSSVPTFVCFETVFVGCSECPWIYDPLSSTVGVLGLQNV